MTDPEPPVVPAPPVTPPSPTEQPAMPAAEELRWSPSHRPDAGLSVLGVILVLVGAAFLVAQYFNIDIGEIGWPVWIIGPGLILLLAGFLVPGGSGMIIGGTVVTAIGLLLFYQDATDHWESWAYAWALIGPGASGVGIMLAGLRDGHPSAVRAGFSQAILGLGLFAAGYLFFEGILNISGRRLPLPEWVVPVGIVALGLLLLVRGVMERRPRS
jgi:hypothetical protein